MNWFTSDLHFGHKNIIRLSNRPFKDLDEMNRVLIENILEAMEEGDTLYHIGDLSFCIATQDYFLEQMSEAGLKLVMIKGNHEKIPVGKWSCLDQTVFPKIMEIKIGSKPVTLCHFPMLTFNKSHFNAWHLYGHHHRCSQGIDEVMVYPGKRINVNCEFHDFKPWSEDEIISEMSKKSDNWDKI